MATESLIDGWWSTFGLGSETVDIAKTKERRSLSPRNALRRASSEVTEPPKTRKNRSPPPRPPVRVRTPPLAEAAAPSVAAVPPPRGRPALKFDSTPSQASALDRQRCGEIDTEGASTSNGNKFTSIAPHLLPPPPPTGSLRNDRTHTPPSSGTGRLARQRPAPLGVKKQHKWREPGSARSESPPHSPPMKGLNPSIGQDEVDDGVELRPRAVTGTERLRRMVGFRKSKTPSRGALLSGVGSAMAEGISNPVGRMLMNNVLVNRAAVFLAHGNTKVEETAISLEENSACVEKDSGHAHQSVHSSAANHNAQQRAAERAAKAATAMAQWEWLGRPEVLPAQLKQNGLLDDRHQRRSVKCVVWDAPHCSAKEKFALKVREGCKEVRCLNIDFITMSSTLSNGSTLALLLASIDLFCIFLVRHSFIFWPTYSLLAQVMVRGSIQGGRRDAKACEALNERDIMLALKGSPWHTQLINSFYSENHLYMLLEYAPSLSMDQHIEWGRGLKRGGVMALRFYTACAIEALAYMYEKQIVHRDVKPSNLLIDGQGYLKLCDYGLSKFLKVGERTSTHLGTLAYIPPEQVKIGRQKAEILLGFFGRVSR